MAFYSYRPCNRAVRLIIWGLNFPMLISLFFNASNKIKSVSCLPSYKINLKERIHFSYWIKLIAPLDLMKT